MRGNKHACKQSEGILSIQSIPIYRRPLATTLVLGTLLGRYLYQDENRRYACALIQPRFLEADGKSLRSMAMQKPWIPIRDGWINIGASAAGSVQTGAGITQSVQSTGVNLGQCCPALTGLTAQSRNSALHWLQDSVHRLSDKHHALCRVSYLSRSITEWRIRCC